jgi:hypothetical protein
MTQGMRNPKAEHTDFGFLQGCISQKPKVMPVNVDMLYEINGYFLVGEWKNSNEQVSEGQKYALKALSNTPKFTVLIINGVSNSEGTVIGKIYKVQNQSLKEVGSGITDLKALIQKWADWVQSS